MRVVQLVIKNASELDYTVPLIWKLKREHDDAEVTIVYCVADRREIVRDATIYSAALADIGVQELDFGHFLRPWARPVQPLWRRLFHRSYSDELSIRENLAAAQAAGFLTKSGALATRRLVRAIAQRARRSIQRLALRLVAMQAILPSLNPDVVLLGNRTRTDFPGRHHLFRWFETSGRRVILVPHAAHETERDEFIAADEQGDALPTYADYWVVLPALEVAREFPGQEHQFPVVGYPGLDPEWTDWFREIVRRSGVDQPDDSATVVLLGRKFVAPGAPRPQDPFTLTYSEAREIFEEVRAAIAGLREPVHLIFKPHPSTNLPLLEGLIAECDFPSLEVSVEPVAALAARATVVMGIFSTALVVPMAFGVPTILIRHRLQEYVDRTWSVMADLYGGLEFVAEQPSDVGALLARALAVDTHERPTPDERHLAKFFPNDSMRRCIDRLVDDAAAGG